jgi:CHAT domain-containing protein
MRRNNNKFALLLSSLVACALAAPLGAAPTAAISLQERADLERGNHLERAADYARALEAYRQLSSLSARVADTNDEEQALCGIGTVYYDWGKYRQALEFDQKSLTLASKIGDKHSQERDLCIVGHAYVALCQYGNALHVDTLALSLDRSRPNGNCRADALADMGNAYNSLSEYQRATRCFENAISICARSGEKDKEANAMDGLGRTYGGLTEYATEFRCLWHALSLYRQVGDRYGQAIAFVHLGNAFNRSSQYSIAIKYLHMALPICVRAQKIDTQADIYHCLGDSYADLSQFARAIECSEHALSLYKQLNDELGATGVLDDIGVDYYNLGNYATAISFYREALAISEQLRDPDSVAGDLNDLGVASYHLGQYDDAIAAYHKALAIYHEVGDKEGLAYSLGNMGDAEGGLLDCQDAVANDIQAVKIARKTDDKNILAMNLIKLANADRGLKRFYDATACYDEAMPLLQHNGNLDGQARVLVGLGDASCGLGLYMKAISYYDEALPIDQQIRKADGEAKCLAGLMAAWRACRKLPLAIYYGKQSVNVCQTIRAGVVNLGAGTQKSYLTTVESTYRDLADLLIDQGDLPEAEQVLGLLKDQELTDFVQRSAQASPASATLSLTPQQQAAADQDKVLSQPVIALGEQIDELARVQNPTRDQAAQLASLQQQLVPCEAKYQAFLTTQLPAELAQASADTKAHLQDVQNAEGALQGDLQQMGPGTVALFTLVEPDKYRVVVVTSQTEKAEEYDISSADLRKMVLQWREALMDPDADPRPLGEKLYTVLIGPIEADLAQAHAQVLMWSLDDVLRYVPMAALYDGKQYLVERYQNEVFTGASVAGLGNTASSRSWRVLALGVSKPHDVTDPTTDQTLNFPALNGVPQEIAGIISGPGDTGTLPGEAYLDTGFTQQEMLDDLNLHYPVVHIASHFYFGKDYKSSFLLLGDGSPFTMDTIATSGQMFQRVDLLTLSACETAMASSSGDGHEVESFGMLAQEKGAASILASLWPVADQSTQALMDNFYRIHGAGPGGVSKAEALQQAQFAMLRGQISPSSTTPTPGRDAEEMPTKTDPNLPPFTPDPKAPYAHPYYWAPFVLIGDWK